jgi:hypothetical protein
MQAPINAQGLLRRQIARKPNVFVLGRAWT